MSSTAKSTQNQYSFTLEEIDSLLDDCEEILPVNSDDWDIITSSHLSAYPSHKCDKEILEDLYRGLHKPERSSCNPALSPQVRRAKKISKKIKKKIRKCKDNCNNGVSNTFVVTLFIVS